MKDCAENKTLLLVDGHGLAFRGFYALPEMTSSDGIPTGAILGFMNMLMKAMDLWQPHGIGLFFDPHGPTARDAMYDAYKLGRRPTPDAFKQQMPLILELSEAIGYPIFIEDGVEADDLIAATANAAADEGWDVLILSADKDLLQLLHGSMRMARPSKGITEFKLYDEKNFKDEYGFPPASMADYLALVGDSVDNIPGVAGIGDKTARSLLEKYGNLDAIYEALETLPPGPQKKLVNGRESAYKSYELVVPQRVEPVDRELLQKKEIARDAAYELCSKLGLKRMISRLGLSDTGEGQNLETIALTGPKRQSPSASSTMTGYGAAELRTGQDNRFLTGPVDYKKFFDEDILVLAGDPDFLATVGGDAAELSGEAKLCFNEWLRGKSEMKKLILAGYGSWCKKIPELAEKPEIIRDVELAHYFLHPDSKSHAIEAILNDGHIWTGPKLAARISELWDDLSGDPRAEDMESVMSDIDAPLVPVLAGLKEKGLYVDIAALVKLDEELRKHISETEMEIFSAGGGAINLNSPKQVGELLFEKLRLPVVKRTKTGYSTDVGVLEELSRLPEPLSNIPAKMLEFRECSKMASGFVMPFIKHAESSADGRIHSTFLHTVTGTARLASRDPNVQNLPVFGEWAAKFRRAIRPSHDGCGELKIFVAADYSQIELRVLAHLSKEERLLEAFGHGRDIHLETASWVFDLPPGTITPEQRRFAKTVNFGLLYGMGAHGLGVRMGIPRHQASMLVERYFSVLPRVKDYIDRSAKEAKYRGFTRSVLGRIRPLDEVTTVEGRGGNSIDRVAVNTPIQSTAADIAKAALIRFHRLLAEDHPDAALVLQVHDSLICECPPEKADEIESLLVETMENVRYIDVPLKAEPKRGYSLADV